MSKVTEALAERTGINENLVDRLIDEFNQYVKDCLKNGEEVRITDFVVFDFVDNPERIRRNPRTQEPVVVPAERVPKIRFSPAVKTAIQPDTSTPSPPQLPPVPGNLQNGKLPPIPAELQEVYYLSNGNSYSQTELIEQGITASTPVYHEGTGKWKKASDYFSDLFKVYFNKVIP